jgi:hypothetical protein
MAEYRDLSMCSYFGPDHTALVAIGWLSAQSTFQKGSSSTAFSENLIQLLADPWQPVVAVGGHQCELCQFDGPLGSKNLFVPFQGKIYVAPELIYHYMAAHWYKPPQEFVDAVMNCVSTRSMDYKKALLSNGGSSLVNLAKT